MSEGFTPAKRPAGRRRATTLTEVLVVVGILAVLMALILPAVQKARDAASRAACSSNLRQLALAAHLYSDTHEHLPQGCAYPIKTSVHYVSRQPGLSWHTSLLPFVEQEGLWQRSWRAHKDDPRGRTVAHREVQAHYISVFTCPSESQRVESAGTSGRWGVTSYLGVAGTDHDRNDGIFHPDHTVRLIQVTDGTSTTLLIGERPPGPRGLRGGWYSRAGGNRCPSTQILPAGRTDWIVNGGIDCLPDPSPFRPGKPGDACDLSHFWSLHTSGAHFAFADGSVRFLPYSASSVLRYFATRNGGELVALD